MVIASSHMFVFSFWWKVPKGYMALDLLYVSARTIKRHHHHHHHVVQIKNSFTDSAPYLGCTRTVIDAEIFACACDVGHITNVVLWNERVDVFASGTCPLSPANTYQPDEGALTAKSCPVNSYSSPGSVTLNCCKCKDCFVKNYIYNAIGVHTGSSSS
jgi:hypothetical protein